MKLIFRGVSIDTCKFVTGYGVVHDEENYLANIIHSQGINRTHMTAVDPNTIGVFIGHNDFDGNMIFTGDKLQVNNSIVYEVVFLSEDEYEEKIASFGLKSTKGTFAIDHFAIENGRVIGNIHEDQDGEVR